MELDNTLSRVASVAAVGVAVFPTARDAFDASGGEKFVSTLHLICRRPVRAARGLLALPLHEDRRRHHDDAREARQRNRLYRICGKLIFASIALVALSNLVKPPASSHTLLWLETVCVVSFGISWLVKGGFLGILADKPAAEPTG